MDSINLATISIDFVGGHGSSLQSSGKVDGNVVYGGSYSLSVVNARGNYAFFDFIFNRPPKTTPIAIDRPIDGDSIDPLIVIRQK